VTLPCLQANPDSEKMASDCAEEEEEEAAVPFGPRSQEHYDSAGCIRHANTSRVGSMQLRVRKN
jgi:hypothetical protein